MRVVASPLVAALVTAGCAASAGPPSPTEIPIERHDIHAHCPLAVDHPSVALVRSRKAWAQMLAQAHTVPPPYEPTSTDFNRTSILVIALPRTPAPTTKLAVPQRRALLYSVSRRRLDATLEVAEPALAPGMVLPTVVGSACAVLWLPAIDALHVTARNSAGALIAESRPQ